MGNVILNSRRFISNHYPEMKVIIENDTLIVWEGRFYIDIEYEGISVNSAPRLGIKFHKCYPSKLPIVYDLDDRFSGTSHRFVILNPENEKIENYRNKKLLCLASYVDMDLQLSNSLSIEDYVIKFLLPYFISYEGFVTSGKYVFGERKHGADGIYESLADYFLIDKENRELLRDLLIWSTKTKKFKDVFIPPHHKYIEKNII